MGSNCARSYWSSAPLTALLLAAFLTGAALGGVGFLCLLTLITSVVLGKTNSHIQQRGSG